MFSRNIYAAGKGRYTNFCKSTRVPVIMTNEYTLILFLTDFVTAYIDQATIKVYLSALRNLHVSKHFHYEFTQQVTPQLQLILRSIKYPPTRPEFIYPLPSKSCMVHEDSLHRKPPFHTNTIFLAACCLALFEC